VAGRKALLVATYDYSDSGLSRLTAPAHDAESLAEVLRDPTVAGFDVTVLINEPTHVVGEAIADFYGDCRRDDLTLLYFSGHGLKDDNGRLYLAMANTRRDALLFTGLSAAQINEALDACASRRKVLILDCCYSGAFPAGVTAKADEMVNTLERFQGKGRAVLTASDATQYSFEGESLQGAGSQSVFTRYLVEAIRSGEADLDADGDIALDELYSYVHEKVVAERPQQRPKKQEDVDGRILIARNVHWTLPTHLRYAIESPISAQRLSAVEGLAHLHRVGNELVRAVVAEQIAVLADDDSRSVSTAARALLAQLGTTDPPAPATSPAPLPPPRPSPEPPSVVPAATEPPPSVTAATAREPEPASEGPPLGPRVAAAEPVPSSGSRDRLRNVVLLGTLLVAAVLFTASRYVALGNSDVAADLGWTLANWTLEVTVPLALAGLLLTRGTRRAAAAVGYGLVAGVALGLIGEMVAWKALLAYEQDSVDSGWSILLAGVLVLILGVAYACSAPWLRARPLLRRDPVAVGALLIVAAAIAIWVLAVGAVDLPPGQWLFYKGQGLIFTVVCVPVTVLRLDRLQRLVVLAALTAVAAGLVAGGAEILVHSTSGFDAGAVLRALVAVLAALGACYAAQLAPEIRPTRRQAAVN